MLCAERTTGAGELFVTIDLPECRLRKELVSGALTVICSRTHKEDEGLPVAGTGRRFLQTQEALPASLGRLVGRERLEPAGSVVDAGIVRLDDLEARDLGDAVLAEVALDLVLADRVEVEVDGLRG